MKASVQKYEFNPSYDRKILWVNVTMNISTGYEVTATICKLSTLEYYCLNYKYTSSLTIIDIQMAIQYLFENKIILPDTKKFSWMSNGTIISIAGTPLEKYVARELML